MATNEATLTVVPGAGLDPAAISRFRAGLRSEVIEPDDPGYESARRVYKAGDVRGDTYSVRAGTTLAPAETVASARTEYGTGPSPSGALVSGLGGAVACSKEPPWPSADPLNSPASARQDRRELRLVSGSDLLRRHPIHPHHMRRVAR